MKTRVCYTQPQFFQICTALISLAEWISTQKPRTSAILKKLTETVGYPVVENVLFRAVEATGIVWPRRKEKNGPRDTTMMKVVVLSLIDLLSEVGLKPSAALIGIRDQLLSPSDASGTQPETR